MRCLTVYFSFNSFLSSCVFCHLLITFVNSRGRSRISGKEVHIDNGGGVRFADFISFFLNIPWEWNNLVSLRPNYFIFVGYFKMGAGEGARANGLNPVWICHWTDWIHTVWHPDSGFFFFWKVNFEKKSEDNKKSMKYYPACCKDLSSFIISVIKNILHIM